jgi:hypothetical protein
MKTYTGELKDGMPIWVEESYSGDMGMYVHDNRDWEKEGKTIKKVYYDNEWQLYKPQAKKVWGVPEVGNNYWLICPSDDGKEHVLEKRMSEPVILPMSPVFLSKEHAEQQAKALNLANEFRLLSDVPVDGVQQWWIDGEGDIMEEYGLSYKTANGICGYVANSREKAERDLAAFPKIALAHKIVTWGFHGGVVEEVL